jgi:hypothetical protein
MKNQALQPAGKVQSAVSGKTGFKKPLISDGVSLVFFSSFANFSGSIFTSYPAPCRDPKKNFINYRFQRIKTRVVLCITAFSMPVHSVHLRG